MKTIEQFMKSDTYHRLVCDFCGKDMGSSDQWDPHGNFACVECTEA